MSECVFCRIVERTLAADIVAEDGELLAFKDVHPQAPTHLLIIPKRHIGSVAELAPDTAHLMADAVVLANRLASQAGLDRGYRLVVNCGPQAGQSVGHVHLHLLGGRTMTWPPG